MFSVHPLKLATVNLEGRFNPPSFEDTRIPVYGFLLRGAERNVLVDTGVGTGNDYVDKTFEPSHYSITDHLADYQLTTEDIDAVINSHLHFDHCGNNQLFRHARFIIQRAELDVARTTLYTVREWFDFDGAAIHPVEGDNELFDGLQVISTPGHTPGHQSVLVNSGERQVLIAAQAAFNRREFDLDGEPDAQAHDGLQSRYLDSITRLKTLGLEPLFSHES